MASKPEEISIRVTLHPNDEIANKKRCPIANSIKDSDLDILRVDVDERYIVFSRKSTDTRYTHWTPRKAKQFIHKLDVLAKKQQISKSELPKPFRLELDSNTLKSAVPRNHNPVSQSRSVRKSNKVAMTQTLRVKKGPQKQPRTGSRSRRAIPTVV
jgi:hypothetical protein